MNAQTEAMHHMKLVATPTPMLAKRAAAAARALALVVAASTAQAALQDRDLNGDSVVDAFYDTDLDLTWLRNADVNGPMNWNTAVAWADGFSFAGYADWRLPTSDTCEGYNCTGSEMGHLYFVELGNPVGGLMTNTGDFQNLQSYVYFSGKEHASNPGWAWGFYMFYGFQGPGGKEGPFYAMAVRDGDVAVVPEPQTALLLLAGLTVLVLARRQRPV